MPVSDRDIYCSEQ